ncbi:MAG: hypothetical protein MK085_09000 [Phycisphaerales bacterium]|nr:hypothetical protein [Phycisphaerales bacterium]
MRYPLLAALLIALIPAGCYGPNGGLYPASNSTFTYYSTTTSPKSITIIDIRTEEAFFTMDLPVGKQLTFKFMDGGGDDSIYTPDRMLWEVWDLGTQTGRLTNQLTAPPSSARRIQVAIRPAPEWPEADEEYRLRIDEEADRPDHWTPEGGKHPKETPIYDE